MQEAIRYLRALALDLPARAGSGHSGTAMALAPLGWLLFSKHLKHDPRVPDWPDRDRFVLSNGHAVVLLYGLLHLCGYDLPEDELWRFRQLGSRTPGHPEPWMTPGIDMATGPLGQGLAAAVGMAWAEELQASLDHRTYVFCSDGDLMEGISHEASSLAGHLKLGKLIVFWDDNRVTIDGPLQLSCSEDVLARYRAYGWHTVRVDDGEDLDALEQALLEAQADPRPSLVGVRTVIGWPAPTMSGRAEAHSPPFSADEIRRTKEILGLPPEQPVKLPAALRQSTTASGYSPAVMPPTMPQSWPEFKVGEKVATRVASGKVLDHITAQLPDLVGGSADLAGSTNTRAGKLHFGVREHAMAGVLLGMTVHGGLRPYGSTYFAFSDYMKPTLRLAALMKAPLTLIFTHDSIGLGEDGPTHQPVEQLPTLRAMPDFIDLRPADAEEVIGAWQFLLARRQLPAGLVLSRQALPVLAGSDREQVARGAYVVWQREPIELVFLCSGSEVHLCQQVAELLEVGSRVVSMPSWHLFELQSPAYQQQVLGPEGLPRLAVEASSSFGWHRWLGSRGQAVTVDQFGASAPGPELMAHFGFTPEALLIRAQKALLQVQSKTEVWKSSNVPTSG